MKPASVSTRPLLDKLGVKPGSRVAVMGLDDPSFIASLRERTPSVARGKPRARRDLVFVGVNHLRDLDRLQEVKEWIEPDGAIWAVRPKGPGSEIGERELIDAGLAAGLVDNKIVSFSQTQGAMRLVFRLRDRPK